MKRIIKLFGFVAVFGLTYILNQTFAKYGVWGLDDINIISREERGADESLKNFNNSEYIEIMKNESEYAKYLSGLEDSDYAKYLSTIKGKQIIEARNQYLEDNFLDEIKLDEVLHYDGGTRLWWPYKYKYSKSKIIIHHTANDISKLTGEDSAKQMLRNIYRYHAITRGWGDVGYNFIIDPYGNIYEGRSGGEGIVGAHVIRNNVDSIGVSLMGNFEKHEPTFAQLSALTKILVSLAKKYKIDPNTQKAYHIETSEKPYLKNVYTYSIVGHKDAGKTSCPGKYLYERLPEIRAEVYTKLKQANLTSAKKDINIDEHPSMNTTTKSSDKQNSTSQTTQKIIKTFSLTKKYSTSGSLFALREKLDISGFEGSCTIDSTNLKIKSCTYKNGFLNIDIEYLKWFATGNRKISIKTKDGIYQIKLQIIWTKDLEGILQQKKDAYKQKFGLSLSSNNSQKILYKRNKTEAKKLVNGNILVLLYNISVDYNAWNIKCDKGCKINIDGKEYKTSNSIKISVFENKLNISFDGNDFKGKQLIKIENNSIVSISNGVELLGEYRGNLVFKKDKINIINNGVKEQIVVINDVDFVSYMKGTGEISEKQEYQKIKTMALLIKGYVLFYIGNKNPHPSLPSGAGYSATDDPRSFQKYVGVKNEKIANLRLKAIEETKNEIILYKGYLPILPYYHCSGGFTLSGLEKYGWTDTPFLKSKLDYYSCEKFSGHGVGLSGQGAQALAQKGWKYYQIIQYYYDGVTMEKM